MGTSKIKLVAADMDGTLLNRDRKITKYTQEVIKKATAGGKFFIGIISRCTEPWNY